MMMWPETAIFIPWDIWLLTWIGAAFWSRRTQLRPQVFGREILYRTMVLAGFVALLAPFISQSSTDFLAGYRTSNYFNARYWALSPMSGWFMVAIVAGGFAFCWWARLYLGSLWSGRITLKEDHHVVDTGPYAFVRHPIYTGIIVASIATAAERGSGYGILGLVLITAGYWIKARMEERFLRETLGADSYDAYARQTAMLIPYLL